MTRRGRCAALAVAWALTGCATLPPPSPALPPGGDALSGRLAVKIEASGAVAARSENAAFDLQGGPAAGRLDLATPLGSVLAQARWSPGSVVLATPQGERRFADLDDLTREVLGESVPVAALFDWLRGRPWRESPSVPTVPPAEPGFTQLGWSVGLARLADGVIVAQRAGPPAVTVRVRVDR